MYTWIKNVKMVNHRNELEAIELMIKDDKIEAIGTDLSLIGIQAEKQLMVKML